MEIDSVISTRERILQFLLLNSPLTGKTNTVKDIASSLDISVNAARQYLIVLEKEGFVVKSQQKSETGRPAMVYSLHESAIEIFPKTYADFAVKLLEQIEGKLGKKATREILEKVGIEIANEVRPYMIENLEKGGSLDSLRDRLNSIKKVYEIYGKFPELHEEEDSFTLKNYNCLVFSVAKEDPLVCAVDEKIITELAGVPAQKERCIREGDECCLYRLKKAKPKPNT